MILHSNILGAGKPFVILHGFLGMSDNWKTLGQKFSESGFQVHLVDQRNHGKSFHSDTFNYEVRDSSLTGPAATLRKIIRERPVVHCLTNFCDGINRLEPRSFATVCV